MLTLYSIKDIILNNFEILEYETKINTKIYNVKYNNLNYLIEPKTVFNNCSYILNKINKIRININYSIIQNIKKEIMSSTWITFYILK